MKLKQILFASIFVCNLPFYLAATTIKTVFVDVEALFETQNLKAAKYVGIIDSLKYSSKVGHKPSQADVFTSLMPVTAQTTLKVYNNDLEMPLILSDWLLGVQPINKIKDCVLNHLKNAKLSDIEKIVLSNIANMMLTPTSLANTQQTTSQMPKVIESLKSLGHKVYLVGNWADMTALKEEFEKVFAKLDGFLYSGKLHLLKPYQDFYTEVLSQTKTDASQALWIEKEQTFIKAAQKHGYNVAVFNPNKPKHIHDELQKFGIKTK